MFRLILYKSAINTERTRAPRMKEINLIKPTTKNCLIRAERSGSSGKCGEFSTGPGGSEM